MQQFSRELVCLQLCLEALQEDQNARNFPDQLKPDLQIVLDSCDIVVKQMSALLQRHSSGSLSRRMQWSFSSKDEAEGLLRSLESHKSAIEIALELSSLTVVSSIKVTTTAIATDTAHIPEIRQHVAQIDELRIEVEALRFQLLLMGKSQGQAQGRINDFLNDSVSYSEYVLETQSVIDTQPGEGTVNSQLLQRVPENRTSKPIGQTRPRQDTVNIQPSKHEAEPQSSSPIIGPRYTRV